MIKPAVRFIILMTPLFALLIWGAIQVGPYQPPTTDFNRYFHACDGIPCYLGVIPGKTSWVDALKTFENASGIQFDSYSNTATNPPGFVGSAQIYALQPTGTVDQIQLNITVPNISLASVIQYFGYPCAVQVTDSTQVELIFTNMMVGIYIDPANPALPLRAATPVSQIVLFNRFSSCEQAASSIATVPWRGFARYTN